MCVGDGPRGGSWVRSLLALNYKCCQWLENSGGGWRVWLWWSSAATSSRGSARVLDILHGCSFHVFKVHSQFVSFLMLFSISFLFLLYCFLCFFPLNFLLFMLLSRFILPCSAPPHFISSIFVSSSSRSRMKVSITAPLERTFRQWRSYPNAQTFYAIITSYPETFLSDTLRLPLKARPDDTSPTSSPLPQPPHLLR